MYVPSSDSAAITRAYLAATYPTYNYTTNAINTAVGNPTELATPLEIFKRDAGGSGAVNSLTAATITATTLASCASVPSSGSDLTNKTYVDGAIAAAGGSGVATATPNTVAKRDGAGSCAFVACKAEFFNDKNGNTVLYTTQTPHSTLVGAGSGGNLSGDDNTCVGYLAGQSISTGVGNSAIGKSAMAGNFNTLTGSYNHADGRQAGYKLTGAATSNTFAGDSAGFAVTTGSNNVAVGQNCLAGGATGTMNYCTVVGSGACNVNTASDIVAVGYNALKFNTTGVNGTAIGTNALGSNVVGPRQTAVGHGSLSASAPTALNGDNTAVGYNAGSINTTGTQNTYLGSGAGASGLGTLVNSMALGAGAVVAGSNEIRLGNTSVTDVITNGSITTNGGVSANTNVTTNGSLWTGLGQIYRSGATLLDANTDTCISVGKNATVTGAITNATAIGNTANVTASNTIQLGNTSVTAVNTSGAITCAGLTSTRGTLTNNLYMSNQSANKVIALTDAGTTTDQTQHNFAGFGTATNILRCQLPTTTDSLRVYAATSSSASNEVFRVSGAGTTSVFGALSVQNNAQCGSSTCVGAATVGTTLGVTGVLTASGGVVGNLTGNASTATTCTTIPALTGDVTTTGSTNVTTLPSTVVVGKVLGGGYTAGAGTVAGTDTILQAIQKLDGNTAAAGGVSTATNNAVAKRDGSAGCAFGQLTATGLLLPSTGGTPTALTFYQEYSYSTTFTGAFTTSPITIRMTRIGNVVNISSAASSSSGTVVANTTLATSTPIPSQFRPSTRIDAYLTTQINGANQQTNFFIQTDGLIGVHGSYYNIGEVASFSTFNVAYVI